MPATFTIKAVTSEWRSRTETGRITGTCVWLVTASEAVTPYQAERAGSPITGMGETMPGTSSGVPCVSRTAEPVDQTRTLYRVTCEYDSTLNLSVDPEDDGLIITYGTESLVEEYFKDKATTPKLAQNTAAEPFPELPTRENSILVINTRKNVAGSTNFSTYYPLRNRVNNANVTIDGTTYAAGTLLLSSIGLSEKQDRNGTEFRTLTCSFKARDDGWKQKFESRGLNEVISTSPWTLAPIIDPESKAPVLRPRPLDSAGAALDPDDEGFEIELTPYESADFTGLV